MLEVSSKSVVVLGPLVPEELLSADRVLVIHTPIQPFERALLEELVAKHKNVHAIEAPPIFIRKNLIGHVDIVVTTLPPEYNAAIIKQWSDRVGSIYTLQGGNLVELG
jgi:hypothetical protein